MHHERGYRTPFGDTMWWRAGAGETDGAYSLHERIAPPESASFPHVHSRMSEAFYVLSGRFSFTIGEREVDAPAGAYVIAPPGVRHAWRVVGDDEARALVIFAPAVTRAYFEELDALMAAGGGRPDPEALAELSRKHGWD